MSDGNVGVWGWDSTTLQWRKLLIDAAGHLQVDTLSSALPAGAATAANQATIIGHVDGIEGVLGQCYGYDGTNWQTLLVESAALKNLRVRLYAGENAIDSHRLSAFPLLTERGLIVSSVSYYFNTDAAEFAHPYGFGDEDGRARTAAAVNQARLYGYNGATWDRLRTMTPADAFTTPTFALQVGSFLMGYDGSDWNMVRVDAAGHLQVDVITAGATESHIWGYDGSIWRELLVESNTDHNLRVKLYDGAYGIVRWASSGNAPVNTSGLFTHSVLRAYDLDDAVFSVLYRKALADGMANTRALWTIAGLAGFNGATWDRLRTYEGGILKVGRAEVGLLDIRMTGTGQVGATGARKLYWIHENPSAGSRIFDLTDATASGQAVKFDHFSTEREGHMITFDPPLEFSNGIYLEVFTNYTSLIFGYL